MRNRTWERQTYRARILEEKLVVTQIEGSEHSSAVKWSFKKTQNMLPLVYSWLEGEGEQEERAGSSSSWTFQPPLTDPE